MTQPLYPQAADETSAPRPCEALAHHTLYDVAGRMGGWPSVMASATGELVAVFSGDRRHHVDPFGKTLLARSSDRGVNWHTPEVVNDTYLDDRDPGLVETGSGAWVLSYFTSQAFATWEERARLHYGDREVDTWRSHIERLTPELLATGLGSFVRRSTDRGRSWSDPVRVPVSAPHGPVLDERGHLLYLGTRMGEGPAEVGLCGSWDDGATWQWLGTATPRDCRPGVLFCEPHLAVLPGGRLVGMLRANADREVDRLLYQIESDDGGQTWSEPRPTALWGLPPHLLLHSSGTLICSYGHRRHPFGQRAALSQDGGRTWSSLLTLAEVEHAAWQHARDIGPGERPGRSLYYQEPDLGYPCTAELDDGTLYTVYYESFPDRPGAAIRGLHWRLGHP